MISLADGGNLVARVRMYRGRIDWLIGVSVALLAGSALVGQQAQFQGSVPTGVASPTPVALTLRDAIGRGLRTNLGVLLSGQASESARGERLRSLSALLPQVTGEGKRERRANRPENPRDKLSSPRLLYSSNRRPVPVHRCARLCLL